MTIYEIEGEPSSDYSSHCIFGYFISKDLAEKHLLKMYAEGFKVGYYEQFSNIEIVEIQIITQ
jgi:hypothetical protein